jgi:hypothetical protein
LSLFQALTSSLLPEIVVQRTKLAGDIDFDEMNTSLSWQATIRLPSPPLTQDVRITSPQLHYCNRNV